MSTKNLSCPKLDCHNKSFYRKDGLYFRRNDSRYIQRYRCLACGRRFSKATFEFECHQKKRRINYPLLKLLCSGVSQRRSALILGVNPKTVARKLTYLAEKYGSLNMIWRNKLELIEQIQIDDLITIEHTKLKPLTVTTIVNPKTREIMALEVGRIPAFGLLAKLSRKKYGKRENEHPSTLRNVLNSVIPALKKDVLIQTDEHHLYPLVISELIPTARHETFKGEKSALIGHGELKKLTFDPLFGINHTYAMFRDNINRLVRKTWATTKIPEKLKAHLEIYVWFHNNILIK